MVHLDLNDKFFKPISTSENGEVNADTIFHYRQKGDIVWATYEGGSIRFGTLSGQIKGDTLIFTYQHQNKEGEFLTGSCESVPEVTDGRIRLYEKWVWTCGDFSHGESVIEETVPPDFM